MRKKILITILIIIILFQTIAPIKINAFVEKSEIISAPGQIEKQKAEDIVSPSTGLDTVTGIMLEPTVSLITYLVDVIMGTFSAFMTSTDIESVMVSKDEREQDLGEAGTTYTISDMTPYENAFGILDISYPRFKYSPEEIFAGKIDILDINFLNDSNTDESWGTIRNVVSSWYKVLRMLAIIGLLSVLIYTGIKIIISANTKDKAKYKGLIVNWFIAVVLAFTLHYIMAFILSCTEELMGLLGGLTGIIKVEAGDVSFQTNLIGLARFQLQQMHFSAKIAYLIIYIALVVYTFKFTILYLKRVLKMAFLTVISPLVALTYPIDKMDGKARGFEMWLKEYIFNALLQPLHYILYYILVTSSLALASKNLVYAIIALAFISEAERLLKRIFGFDKATGGTVGGIAGAYATGAIAGAVTRFASNPLHFFGGGQNGTISGSRGDLGNGEKYNYEEVNDIKNDTNLDDFFGVDMGRNTVLPIAPTIPGIDTFISSYRQGLPLSIQELGGLNFEDDPRSMEELLQEISQNQRELRNSSSTIEQKLELENNIANMESILNNRIMSNEMNFSNGGINPLQYIDGDNRSSADLMTEIMRLNELANDPMLASNERRSYRRQSEKLMRRLNRRMAQNQYIQRQGGIEALMQPDQIQPETQEVVQEQQEERRKMPRAVRGMANVARTMAKPVWDTEKDASYNGKKLTGNAIRGIAGVSLGVTAAAVQAGVSITDGKYNPLEGAATIGAGIAVASKIGRGSESIGKTYKDGANAGNKEKEIEEYGKQWFNRDDVIEKYNREFPGQGKEMRSRAKNNYISRGITDVKEQTQAMKYANQLKKERGMSEEEADKLAIATLQYKRDLTQNSNYTILFDQKKRGKYLDAKVNAYAGSQSSDSVRRLHDNFIENVKDFNRANR